MAFSDWLVPKPSLAAEANLRHAIHAVRNEGPQNVSRLIDLTETLLAQNMHYKTLLRQAIGHVAELEMQALLKQSTPPE